MEFAKLNSNQLIGANAYFTGFDDFALKGKHKEKVKRKIERDLKILLLSKNNVVCAASHIVNPISFDIIWSNPELLTENMLKPALRKDKAHIYDYLERYPNYNANDKLNIKTFYQDNLRSVVEWELSPNTINFMNMLCESINNPNSILMLNLNDKHKQKALSLKDEIRGLNSLSREQILNLANNWNYRQRNHLLSFVNFIYHLSGAQIVNCESSLPFGNYVDYSTQNVVKGKVYSETQLFTKLFLDLAFELISKPTARIKLDRLDDLSFQNISVIRDKITKTGIFEKYDHLVKTSSQLYYQESNKTIEDIRFEDFHGLVKLINEIENTFTDVLKNEAVLFSQKELSMETNKLTFNFVLNMIYHVLSAADVAYNSLSGIISALPYFRSLITNHLNTANLGYVESIQKIKAKNTNTILKKASISKNTSFYDLIKLIQEGLHGNEKITL